VINEPGNMPGGTCWSECAWNGDEYYLFALEFCGVGSFICPLSGLAAAIDMDI
jgi:hypothetical protein